MSSQYFEFFIRPADDEATARYLRFAVSLEQDDADELRSLDSERFLEESDYLEGLVDNVTLTEDGSAPVVIGLDGSTIIDPDALLRFLQALGAQRIETRIFNSQVGEYIFFEDTEYRDNFGDTSWQWLDEPEPEEDADDIDDSSDAHLTQGAISATEASAIAKSPFLPFFNALGMDGDINPAALLETLEIDSILGKTFRQWLAPESLGEEVQYKIVLPQVSIHAHHSDLSYYLQIDFHPIVRDGEKLRHMGLESIQARLEQLDVPFIKTNFHSTTMQCEWVGDNLHVRLKLFTGHGSLIVSGPDETILAMSLEELARWYTQAGGPGTSVKNNPVVKERIAAKLASDPDGVDNPYYLRYLIEDEFAKSERLLDKGVQLREPESVYEKARVLSNSLEKYEVLEAQKLMEVALELGHERAQASLERIKKDLDRG